MSSDPYFTDSAAQVAVEPIRIADRNNGNTGIAAPDLLLYLRQQRTDCLWLTVSSWGRPYRLGREEFDRCRRGDSASLLCTILDVRAK